METFRRLLLHDITPASFADIYAQTIVYGLFAARLNDKTPEDFSRQEALGLIPKTSHFLRNMFQQIAGLDPDPRIEWVLDDLVLAFGITDMQKILSISTQSNTSTVYRNQHGTSSSEATSLPRSG
jgi:hypothetical protein